MPEREERSAPDELRHLLIQAAREILREPGTPLELRKVADRAGKSRTAPYLVFGKESEGGGVLALRIAVAAEGAREMSQRMVAAARGEADPILAFRRVAEAFLAFVEENRRLFRLMYGPDIDAVGGIGEDGFLHHPEFRALLAHRDRAGTLVADLIRRGQAAELLTADPEDGAEAGAGPLETPGARYLQIAWASMIGVAQLRDDELLRTIGWNITREQGARLIVESVFGVDPRYVEEAARPFLESRSVSEEDEGGPPGFADAMELRGVSDRRAAFIADPAARPSSSLSSSPTPRSSLGETLRRYSGLRRATQAQRLLSRAWVLWIDDNPEWISSEVETLRRLGANVTVAEGTAEAVALLRAQAAAGEAGGRGYDLIVSDIARGGRADEGVRALPELRRLAPEAPVIFFIADLDPRRGVPAGAAGITNRTDELLHLVVDVLEGR